MKNYPYRFRKILHNLCQFALPALLLIAFATPLTLLSVTATWNSGNILPAERDWITDGFTNWAENQDPAGNDILIGANGRRTFPSQILTNHVNQTISVNSLLYQYNVTTQGHITEISENVTLNVGGTADPYVFSVGAYVLATEPTTHAQLQGNGTLSVNQSGGVIFLGSNTTAGGKATTSTNMDGLAGFAANLGSTGSFQVGTNTPFDTAISQYSRSTVTLAQTNSITTGLLAVSSVVGDVRRHVGGTTNDAQSTLLLGLENTFHTDKFHVGRGYHSLTNGVVALKGSLVESEITPTLLLRGYDGTSAVEELLIAVDGGPSSGNQILFGSIDLTGIEVDAVIDTIVIASAKTTTAGHANGSLTLDKGSIVATNVTVGQTVQGGAASTGSAITEGNLIIKGGSASLQSLRIAESDSTLATNVAPIAGVLSVSGSGTSVEIENGIVMGHHAGVDNNAPLTATINLLGGLLAVEGNIGEGQVGAGGITSTLNLSGGTLELNGNDVTVGTFNAESGTLRNLGELNGGGDLVKSTAGVLTLEGNLAHTGITDIQAGTLLINGELLNSAVSVGANGILGGSGILNGNLHLDAGAEFIFSAMDSLTVNGGSVTFGGFSVDNLMGLDSSVELGIYTLLAGDATVNTTNISNLGSTNPYDLGDGKFAYFQTGSLELVVIPEPGTWAIILGLLIGGWVVVARSRRRS